MLALDSGESHHLLRVMRAQPGHALRVFGGGLEFSAVLSEARGKTAVVKLLTPVAPVPEPCVAMTFAVPWLKGDHAELVVRKLTELGAAQILFYDARREVARGDGRKAERMQKIAVEACKQCGRAVVPPVCAAGPVAAAVRSAGVPVGRCFLLDESEHGLLLTPALERAGLGRGASGFRVLVASGPEGGFDPAERAGIAGLAVPVSLGARILRAETAPLAAAAVILSLAGEL